MMGNLHSPPEGDCRQLEKLKKEVTYWSAVPVQDLLVSCSCSRAHSGAAWKKAAM